jgi:hypothetical protein
MNKRPLAATIIGCLFIVVGAVGFVYHISDVHADNAFHYDGLLIELVRVLAIVAGAFMLRGHNWARWLVLAWMAFHVVISIFNGWGQVAMHALFLAVLAYFLFRPEVTKYFRRGQEG